MNSKCLFEAMLLTPGLCSSAKETTLRKSVRSPTPHVFYSAAGEGRARAEGNAARRGEAMQGEREIQRVCIYVWRASCVYCSVPYCGGGETRRARGEESERGVHCEL